MYIAVKVNNEHTRSLLAYAHIVLDIARRHRESGWLANNAPFRAQLFAGGAYKWNEVNPPLLASAVLDNTRVGEGAKVCTKCMSPDHLTDSFLYDMVMSVCIIFNRLTLFVFIYQL